MLLQRIARGLRWTGPAACSLIVACAPASRDEPFGPTPIEALVSGTQIATHLVTAVPLMTIGDQPLFASEVSLHAIDSMLSLKSGYALRAGDLLTPTEGHRWRAGLMPASLGRQRIGQEARMRLPVAASAPLLLALRYEQEQTWLPDNTLENLRQGVDLQWAPSFARLQLQWDAAALPWDARSALDCPLRGQVGVPLSGPAWQLQLGGRSCAVSRPAPDAFSYAAQTWSARVQWRAEQQQASLRVLTVEASPVDTVGADADAAYEVGVEHERLIGDWAARAGVAWRTSEAPVNAPAAWVADASLRRNLGMMAVSAQWHTGDRYWFIDGYAQPSDDLALSLDLSRWAALHWPGYAPVLALSYQWRLAADGYRDDSVQWRMWLPWR